MIYFDSDMTKSISTVVYFDWKTVIYIYVCCQIRADDNSSTCTFTTGKSVTCTAHVLMSLYPIDKSLVSLQSERRTSC